MIASTHDLLSLLCLVLVAGFRAAYIVLRLWNYPLSHGREFFLGVQVRPGFYEGPGAGWLKCYRALVLGEHLAIAAAVAVLAVLGRWTEWTKLIPVDVFLYFAIMAGFAVWTRRKLGRGGAAPSMVSRVAIPLESRRLSNFLSWPREGLMAALVAGSWFLWLRHGGGPLGWPVGWQQPVLMTYVVAGLLLLEILVARGGFPLPPERTEEHYQYAEATRRHSLRIIETQRWFFAVILAGCAVLGQLPAARSAPRLRWVIVAVALAIWLCFAGVLIGGGRRLAAMGAGLRPACSWAGPSGRPRLMMRGGLAWSIGFCAGLAVLLTVFQR
jgi:hypothetical protein